MKRKMVMCFFLFGSCISNNNQIQQEENERNFEPPYSVSLEKEIEKIKPAELSNIGGSITYIPLETITRSLLKDLRKIVATDSFIAVHDMDNVLLFDSSGIFLKQIGHRGQGPGAYRTIMDYCFSVDGNKIYLLTTFQECLEYDVKGKFLKSYKIDSIPGQILPLKDELFVFHCINAPEYLNPVRQSLIISDLNNTIQKTYINYHKRVKKPGITVPKAPFYYHRSELRFKEFGVDTLYTVTEDELTAYAIFDLGKKEIPAELDYPNILEFEKTLIQHYTGKYFVKGIVEDVDNLYFTLDDYLDNNLYGYYNKSAGSAKVTGDKGFENNIDGGLPFFPKYVYNDSILVDYVNAFELREHVLNGDATEMRRLYGKNYDDLVKLANSLDDESNPIVVMVK